MLINSVTYKANLSIFVLCITKILWEQVEPEAKLFLSIFLNTMPCPSCICVSSQEIKVISHLFMEIWWS